MDIKKILAEIDALESRLRLVRSILTGTTTPAKKKTAVKEKPGPKEVTGKTKRVMSEAGRKAIAAAQKKRWAKTKKLVR